MRRVFEVIMLILEGFLAAGSLFFAFAERGALPKILYVIACILLIPAVPLREKLEKKYGKEGAAKRIYATTDKARGSLKNLANEEGYETFVVPDDVGGRFSVLTAVGLLPIAVAGCDIDKLMEDGTFSNLSKRELLQVTRQRAKLEKNLGSIADLTRLPSAIFVVDVMKEHIAIKEANRLGIPVFAIVDTNSDPKNIDFVIPANDDAKDSVEVILNACCTAIAEGIEERKVEKADEKASEAQQDAEVLDEAPKRATGARKQRKAEAPAAEAAPVAEAAPAAEDAPAAE